MKKGWKIIGVIGVLLLAVVVAGTLLLDGLVKSGIEEQGTELMGTALSVDAVDISIFGGSGSISGLRVQNPDEFSDEPAIQVDEIMLDINILSLLSDRIIVEEIIIKSPVIFFEQKGIGANLKTISDNMEASADEPSEKSLVIDYLLVENGQVNVSTTIDRERRAEASLSEFELTDIGRDGSNSIKQGIRQIMEPLLEQAMEEAIKSGVIDQVENKIRDLFNN